MKPTHLIPLVLVVAACNLFRKDKNEDVAADGAAVTTATGTVGTTAPSLLDKALSFVSGGPFEGEITMNVTNKDKPVETVVYMVKGPKMRFNMPEKRPGESGYAIFDTTTKKVTTVIDSRKMAMVIDLNGAMGNMATRAANAQGNSHVDRTGKTDTVAGYTCEVIKVTSDSGDKTDLCLAKGISFPKMPSMQMAWMEALGADGFPLRVVTTDAAGKEKTRMDVTKVEKKSLDDAQFTVPADYKTTDMSGMMKALGGMGGMGGGGVPNNLTPP